MAELSASFDLPLGIEAPKAARQAVQSLLRSWGYHDPDWLAGVSVVVSELVSNAVVHGGGCLALDLQAHDQTVTIGAADGSAAVPRRAEPEEYGGGRGLTLIEALSRSWRVTDHQGGKRVVVNLLPPPRHEGDAGG